MKPSILGCCALLLAVGACCHVPPAPTVVWNGAVPPLCSLDNFQIGTASVPGVYVLQLVNDSKSDNSYAFLIFVAYGSATVQNLVGPIVGDDDWTRFYSALGALGSARPGGFWCDQITAGKQGKAEARNRCQGNPHGLLAVPREQLLASGPKPPSPPPPDITGFVQVSSMQDLTALGAAAGPRGMLASLQPVVGGPTPCQKLDRGDPRIQGLGTYVQRAVDAVNLLSPGVIH